MKRISILILAIVLAGCRDKKPSPAAADVSIKTNEREYSTDIFNGKWQGKTSEGLDFDLWLYAEDGFISGQYCTMTDNASMIDCGEPDEVYDCNVKGKMGDTNTIISDVISCHSLKKGKVQLVFKDKGVEWTTLRMDGTYGQDHLLPDKIILSKISNDAF